MFALVAIESHCCEFIMLVRMSEAHSCHWTVFAVGADSTKTSSTTIHLAEVTAILLVKAILLPVNPIVVDPACISRSVKEDPFKALPFVLSKC